jgi:hypothetical protein
MIYLLGERLSKQVLGEGVLECFTSVYTLTHLSSHYEDCINMWLKIFSTVTYAVFAFFTQF